MFDYISDNRLIQFLTGLRDSVTPILAINLLCDFTDHSVAHSDELVSIVNQLIAPIQYVPLDERLTDEELGILYAACYLHDVGMNWKSAWESNVMKRVVCESTDVSDDAAERRWNRLDKKGQLDLIRQYHHELSYEMIMGSLEGGDDILIGTTLPRRYKPEYIACVCRSHGLSVDSSDYEKSTRNRVGIRISLLSSLLRLADMLDESQRRANPYEQRLLGLDVDSAVHWWRHYYTEYVHFDQKTRSIVVYFDFTEDNRDLYCPVIAPLQIPRIQNELDSQRYTLNQYGLNWSLVEDTEPKDCSSAKPIPDKVFREMRKQVVLSSVSIPEDVLRFEPDAPPTEIFQDVLAEICDRLDKGTRLLAVVGEAGLGKSRVAAGLFSPDTMDGTLPGWFVGNCPYDLHSVAGAAASAVATFPGAMFRVILDERHDGSRGPEFFEKFLRELWQRKWLSDLRYQVVLTLRNSTFERLCEKGLLSNECAIHLDDYKHLLMDILRENPVLWGQEEHLDEDEIRHIEACCGESSLLIDLWLQARRRGLSLNKDLLIADKSIQNQLYDGFISTRPSFDQYVLRSLCLARSVSRYVPPWFIAVVAKWGGTSSQLNQVIDALQRLQQDGLVDIDTWLVEPDIYVESVRFSHDTIQEAVAAHTEFDFALVKTELPELTMQLLSENPPKDIDAFESALQMWTAVALTTEQGTDAAIGKIESVTKSLPKNKQVSRRIVSVVAVTASMLGRELSNEVLENAFKSAFASLASIVGDRVSSSDLADICAARIRITGLINHYARCYGAHRTARFSEFTMTGNTAVGAIGRRLADVSLEQVMCEVKGFTPRIRYSQFLIYAHQYAKAGRFITESISDSLSKNDEPFCIVTGRVDMAAAAYLQAGCLRAAVDVYRMASEQSTTQGLPHLAAVYQFSADSLASAHTRTTLEHLIAAQFEEVPYQLSAKGRKGCAVVSCHADVGIDAVVAKRLEERGVPACIIYSDTITALQSLPADWGIVLLGGHMGVNMEQLLNPYLTDDDWMHYKYSLSDPPEYTRLAFDVCGRPARWVAAYYIQHVLIATECWLQSDDFSAFVTQIRS